MVSWPLGLKYIWEGFVTEKQAMRMILPNSITQNKWEGKNTLSINLRRDNDYIVNDKSMTF